MLRAVVHPASMQDRDGLACVLDRRMRRRLAGIEVVFADRGPKAAAVVAQAGTWMLQILRRDPEQTGFAVLPMRRVVKRTLSSLRRNRRRAKDVEHLARSAEAMIKPMPRRLCR